MEISPVDQCDLDIGVFQRSRRIKPCEPAPNYNYAMSHTFSMPTRGVTLPDSEQLGVFIGQPGGAKRTVQKNMARLPRRKPSAIARHFVIESQETAVYIRNSRTDRDLFVEPGRAQIAAMRLADCQQDAVFEFHLPVVKPESSAIIHAPHFHPDEVIGVIHNTHLVRLGVSDANGCAMR